MSKHGDYILGLHGFSAKSSRPLHDTGVSLVSDGKIIYATNEERFSRKKNDGNFPFLSYENIFDEMDIGADDLSSIAFPDKRSVWQTYFILLNLVKTYRLSRYWLNGYFLSSLERAIEFRRVPPKNIKNIKKYFIEHHLCHAASAYYTSPWDDTCIVTLDGMGDYSIGGSVSIGLNNKIKRLFKTNGFFSPGLYYMIITSLLGFKAGRHEGKIVGLAAHGDPEKCYPIMEELIRYDKNRHDFFSMIVPHELKHAQYSNGYIECSLGETRRRLEKYKPEDVAAGAQKRLEDIVLEYISDALIQTNKSKLVVAGGVFANVRLNEKIRKLSRVDDIFIYPNMGDGGLASGAALYVSHQKTQSRPTHKHPIDTMYLGPQFSDEEIIQELKESNLKYNHLENIEETIAEAIKDGYIIGHFNGRMEYGPRALGNRSILANPTNGSINDTLNHRLKRTEFMPFAPAILEEHAHEYLIDWEPSHIAARFMTTTYLVNPSYHQTVPAVVHVDGTARPQIVRQEDNARFHKIIKLFYEKTSIPVLINTSFNRHEEPIVCSPRDAISALKDNCIDALAIGNFWIWNDDTE